jgi:hypothetical protein
MGFRAGTRRRADSEPRFTYLLFPWLFFPVMTFWTRRNDEQFHEETLT